MGRKKVVISEDAPFSIVRDLTMLSATQEREGVGCPCCGRLVRIYPRPIHAEVAVFLIKLVRRYLEEPRWYSTEEIAPAPIKSSSDGVYLIHWGLLEKSDDTNRGNAPCGLYRPTPLGIDFVHMKVRVPSHAHLRNYVIDGESKLVKMSDKKIYITEALGKKFDYQELLRG